MGVSVLGRERKTTFRRGSCSDPNEHHRGRATSTPSGVVENDARHRTGGPAREEYTNVKFTSHDDLVEMTAEAGRWEWYTRDVAGNPYLAEFQNLHRVLRDQTPVELYAEYVTIHWKYHYDRPDAWPKNAVPDCLQIGDLHETYTDGKLDQRTGSVTPVELSRSDYTGRSD